MKKYWILLALLAGLGIALVSCNRSWTWHQKITVTVETPDGVKTGSSVMRATLTDHDSKLAPPEARGASFTLSGEAVVVEVMPGKYLFVLLKNMPRPYGLFYPGEAPVDVAPKLEAAREPMTATLKPSQYPMLVTFGDINDPASVKQVDPANLAEQFGPGVSLKSITMTITNEPVTTGKLEDVLVWWSEYENKQLDGDKYTDFYAKNRLANSLNRRDFKNGK